jgi:hypothetical protein
MEQETLSKLETLGPVGIKLRTTMNNHYDFLFKESSGPLKPQTVRMIEKHNIDYNIMIQLSYSIVATGTTAGQNFVQLAIAIGNRIRNFYHLPPKAELNLRLGAFVLNCYAVNNMVLIKLVNDYKAFGKAKTIYKIYMGYNRSDLRKLVKEFSEVHDPFKPLINKAPDWQYGTVTNPNGEVIKLIKDSKPDIAAKINPNNTPIVLAATNKKQKIAYYVNPEVFAVYKWALQTNQDCFEHNSVDTIAKERKEAKKAEALQVLKAAEPYVGKKFYQQYTCDSRGRFYPLSAYLNELNSDNAKGMLSFFEGKPLGNTGKAQLFHHIANMWGEDKLSHIDRVKFVEDNYYTFVKYGNLPMEAKGWMTASEPIQFLSAVIELAKFDKHFVDGKDTKDFVSHTISYRDGSNNGLQWLMSLAKDHKNGHLVNVKPTQDHLPGDMYSYVAKSVQSIMHNKAKEQDSKSLDYYNLYFKSIEKIRNRWRVADLNNDISAERKKKLIRFYQKRYKAELKLTDIIYWDKAKFTHKEWRKIVKRNVMTYGYSASKQGMGEQIIEDTRDMSNVYLSNKQHSAARALGSLVYNTIESEFPEVANTMKLFKDNCEAYMKKHEKQYSHNTLISNFPFAQHYVKYKTAVVKLTDGLYVMNNDKTFKWFNRVDFKIKTELPILNLGKAKAAISPNSIHNLDSLHLMLVIDACDFDIVSAHDSYGSHACNVEKMQKVIRTQFKRIIDASPLEHNLKETGNLVPMITQGQLDSSEILRSEYAFA